MSGQALSPSVFSAVKAALSRLRLYVTAEAVSNATAGVPFVVAHTLGSMPGAVTALPFANAYVWAADADRAMWSSERVVVRCSVASVRVQLILLR